MLPGTKTKVCKGKKPTVEFGAHNVDNTAPVKMILTDLQHKNNTAHDFYCQTTRPRHAKAQARSDFDYTTTAHPLFAFPDDWEGDLNSGYFEAFSYKSMMPKMLTPLQNIEKKDPVTSILKEKHRWRTQGINYHKTPASHLPYNIAERFSQLNEEVAHCPKYLVDVAAHLDSEPHPDFDDSYNWYYAGNGNLQLIQLELEEYLLHSEFNMLYLSHFSRPDLQINTNHAATYNCGEGNLILETVCSANNIVALRNKHKIFILKIVTTNDTVLIEKIKSMESELTYTGISFDNHHNNILYVTSLENTVKIVNLDRLTARTVKLVKRASTMRNNWNTVISSDRVAYTHVTKNGIGVYDKRTNNVAQSWVNVKQVSDLSACNEITAAMQQKGSTSLYCGTNHHLFLLDLRHQVKTKPKPVLRWTHGMQCVPTYLSICNFEYNKELISLSSQWCEDTCVVPNYVSDVMKEGRISGVTMPYRPQSIFQTLHKAKEKLLCYDLYNPIDDRLATSITGQVVLEHDVNYTILMQNSFGDISCHILYPEYMEGVIEDKGIDHLVEWSGPYRREKKPFEVSEVMDISSTLKILENVPDKYKFNETVFKDDRETIKKEIIETFENGGLDPGLLDIWTDKFNDTTVVEDSSLAINLHYSGESESDEGN